MSNSIAVKGSYTTCVLISFHYIPTLPPLCFVDELLTEANFGAVYEAIIKTRSKWPLIGIELKLSVYDLDDTEQSTRAIYTAIQK